MPQTVANLEGGSSGKTSDLNFTLDLGKNPEIRHLQGKIPLFLPRQIANLEHVNAVEANILLLIKKSKLLISKRNKPFIIRRSILTAKYLSPELDIFDQRIQFTSCVLIVFYYLDIEILSSLDFGTVNEGDKYLLDGINTIVGIWKGKYEAFDQIPHKTPALLKPILLLFIHFCQQYEKPMLDDKVDTLRLSKSIMNFAHSTIAYLRTFGISRYSSTACLGQMLRSQQSIGRILLELFQATEKLDINIRQHLLYEQLIELVSLETAYVADVFGFIESMKPQNTKMNLLKRYAETNNVSYLEAFEYAMKFIGTVRADILILAEQLEQEFVGNVALEKFLTFCKSIMDSAIYIYLEQQQK